jgi:hypothetical protein
MADDRRNSTIHRSGVSVYSASTSPIASAEVGLWNSSGSLMFRNADGSDSPAVSSPWTVNWAFELIPTAAATGNDNANTNGDIYWAPVLIPANQAVTGIQYLVGSVGGTDKVIAGLYSAAGVLLASSALAGTTVGTASQVMSVPLTAPYAATGPAIYYIGLQFNGTTAKFRTATLAGFANVASNACNSQAGTFGTMAAITPGTTFTANKGPIAGTY